MSIATALGFTHGAASRRVTDTRVLRSFFFRGACRDRLEKPLVFHCCCCLKRHLRRTRARRERNEEGGEKSKDRHRRLETRIRSINAETAAAAFPPSTSVPSENNISGNRPSLFHRPVEWNVGRVGKSRLSRVEFPVPSFRLRVSSFVLSAALFIERGKNASRNSFPRYARATRFN